MRGPTEAFDLDGTLAFQPAQWVGPHHIGAPIAPMVEQIRKFKQAGVPVVIFTARVSGGDPDNCLPAIQSWCARYLGFVPPITAEKTHEIGRIWDDRAVQILRNTGKLAAPEFVNEQSPITREPLIHQGVK